jgi:hypothetical protein
MKEPIMTPGPWFVGAQNDDLYIIDCPPRPSTDDVAPDRDVAVVAKVYDRGSWAETDANARCLAAAFALREALAELVRLKDIKDSSPDEHERRKAAAWDAARSALRRANG